MKMILSTPSRRPSLTLGALAAFSMAAAASLATSDHSPESTNSQSREPSTPSEDQVVVEVPVSQAKALESLYNIDSPVTL